ncbi:MAG: PD-(D/E)XK nuclease family protein [Candidatus Methanofastidiosa archaeon]|nr:PD-(D/E)XK nuclease family protein [Candidatus Methanofastidiosa archaeon]
MKPNIFSLATKELSQDGFFTWLLQWADKECSQLDSQLNETAKDFVRLLIDKPQDFQITEVYTKRQWENIDILAVINDEYVICIEDKTNTGEHSKQLERYKQIVSERYKDKNYNLVFIYLKTGNESSATLKKIIEKGYMIIDRKAVLNVFSQRVVHNDIFNDFKEHLSDIEYQTNSYTKFENIKSKWKAGEGFFVKLQELISECTDWQYVPNRKGGFLGFWYHRQKANDIGEFYIQIENAFKDGIKLVIKIANWKPSTKTLYKLYNKIKPFAEKNGISIVKPNKYRAAATSTLAIIEDAFTADNEGNLEIDKFIMTLEALEKTIDEYCEEQNTAGSTQ